jgi:hypothetical protein
MTRKQQMELTGMVSENGVWERPITARTLVVPVWWEESPDGFHWAWDDPTIPSDGWGPVALYARYRDPDLVLPQGVREVHYGRGILEDFIGLKDASGQAILRYAQQWGPLQICEHGRPASHTGAHLNGCVPRGTPPVFEERFDDWRRYAREADRILLKATQLHQGAVTPEMLAYLRDGDSEEDRRHPEEALSNWRDSVELTVNYWMRMGAVHPAMRWTSSGPRLEMAATGLFGALCLELVTALARVRNLLCCASCSKWFSREGAVVPGRNQYCPACGRKAKNRRNSKAYRDRERNKKASGQPGKKSTNAVKLAPPPL